MAAAWNGGVAGGDPSYVQSPSLRATIALAMRYWFQLDFTEPTCLDYGGVSGKKCPCGTPGFWSTNWFSNVSCLFSYRAKRSAV